MGRHRLEVAVRIVTGRAVDPALGAGEAATEPQRRPLDPGEFRVIGLDRTAGGVALIAGAQERERSGAPGPRDGQLGESRPDGLDVIQARAVAPFAADPAVLRL